MKTKKSALTISANAGEIEMTDDLYYRIRQYIDDSEDSGYIWLSMQDAEWFLNGCFDYDCIESKNELITIMHICGLILTASRVLGRWKNVEISISEPGDEE